MHVLQHVSPAALTILIDLNVCLWHDRTGCLEGKEGPDEQILTLGGRTKTAAQQNKTFQWQRQVCIFGHYCRVAGTAGKLKIHAKPSHVPALTLLHLLSPCLFSHPCTRMHSDRSAFSMFCGSLFSHCSSIYLLLPGLCPLPAPQPSPQPAFPTCPSHHLVQRTCTGTGLVSGHAVTSLVSSLSLSSHHLQPVPFLPCLFLLFFC